MLFGKLNVFLLRSGFHLTTLPHRLNWWIVNWWIAEEMVILLEDSPLSTKELWSPDIAAIRFLVDGGRFQEELAAASELLPLTDDGGHCAQCHLQSSRNVSVPAPDLCLQIILSEVYRQFFDFLLGLCSDLHAHLRGVLYTNVCLSFPIMPNQLNVSSAGLQ